MYKCSGYTYNDLTESSVGLTLTNGVKVRCASLGDLLEMKKNSLRQKDIVDCLSIEKAMRTWTRL